MKLLIADDNDVLRRLLVNVFSEEFIVYETADGNAALEIFATESPDVVISDNSMPGMTGVELSSKIAAMTETSECLVIMMSGVPLDEIEMAKAKFDYFFIKPFNILKIVELVRKHFYVVNRKIVCKNA